MPTLPRRSFLYGAGALLGLPLLEAMGPRSLFAAPNAIELPRRMAFVFFPNGAIMQSWKPTADGTNFPLPKTLASLEPVRDQVMVVTGLATLGTWNGAALRLTLPAKPDPALSQAILVQRGTGGPIIAALRL